MIHRNLLMLVNFLPVGDTCGMSDTASSMPVTGPSAPGTDDEEEVGATLFERESETFVETNGHLDADGDRNSPVTVGEGRDPLTDSEPVDAERRTIEWIIQLSAPSLSEADATAITSVTWDPYDASVSPEDDMTDQSVTSVSGPVTTVGSPAHARLLDPTLDTMTQTDDVSNTLHSGDHTSLMPWGRSDAQTQVRSRFGHLVKPVNRFIQTMYRQDVV